jgi:hypothetical protein
MRTALAAVLLASSLAFTAGHAQTSGDQDKVRYVIVYGKDGCPRTTRDEIVICSRRPESERLRIPPNLREEPLSPDSESWTKKAERLETMGRTGINSCSAVGPGAGTGCLLEMIKKAREEQQAIARERAKAP